MYVLQLIMGNSISNLSQGNYDSNIIRSKAVSNNPIKIYSDATYDYVCEGKRGVALNVASWRVTRVKLDGTEVVNAGKGDYKHLATDLATVTALTYNEGVDLS